MFNNLRKYELYCILGDLRETPLWFADKWQLIVPALTPLLEIDGKKTGVRSLQYQIPVQVGSAGYEKFGRLGWNQKSHDRWTHRGGAVSLTDSLIAFRNVELWSPIWTRCEVEPPDVYFEIYNEYFMGMDISELSFNPTIVFAVAKDLASKHPAIVQNVVHVLRLATQAKFCVKQDSRPWGFDYDRDSFSDAVNDLAGTTLLEPHLRRTSPITLGHFSENWQEMP